MWEALSGDPASIRGETLVSVSTNGTAWSSLGIAGKADLSC